ncbi:MAG: amino acid ABC transporter permease [Hyphomicrobiales bacterium]|nr:amino acid ABC transporter permease [Hyphomicrobiales bacterium]MCY4049411.1 amino acid ABC transporter permease [Hyphomicrobiales bacterium]MCY4052818.1 amino acid ABC transporter permease [Hyphomicrobiales bacterium]
MDTQSQQTWQPIPEKPPPSLSIGPVGWARKNLFSSPLDVVLTLLGLYMTYVVATAILDWAVFGAVWTGTADDCREGSQACWPFIQAKWGQLIYGRYPLEERWRVDATMIIGVLAMIPMLIPAVPFKKWNAIFLFVIYPVLAFFLLLGGSFALPLVETPLWGGLLVTLVTSIVGIVGSLPLGILLALGRRSNMPVVRMLSIGFIEFWRGVPLITVLFMASVMLPLFLPEGVTLDKLLRCLIGIALFSAAYLAEVVRGGLQAIPRGQYEAANALGLGYWRTMGLIILPQALRLVIPGIVNSFIALLKDTTLVLIVGLFDLLGIIQLSFTDPNWSTPNTANTGYFTAAVMFWCLCFSISRYSQFMERRLQTGHKR